MIFARGMDVLVLLFFLALIGEGVALHCDWRPLWSIYFILKERYLKVVMIIHLGSIIPSKLHVTRPTYHSDGDELSREEAAF